MGGSRVPYAPQTLEQTARLITQALRELGDPLIYGRDFVDDYRRQAPAARPRLVAEAPPPTGDARYDAYLAAVAEHFASEDGHPPPAWVEAPGRCSVLNGSTPFPMWWRTSGALFSGGSR